MSEGLAAGLCLDVVNCPGVVLTDAEWATDDLMSKLQSNPVLLRGLQNPKCQEAMQLMQSDPSAAKKK